MTRLFFLLSGEHETLPISELKAILRAEGYTFKILEKLDQALRLEADLNCIDAIKHRTALTRLCGMELFCSQAKARDIIESTCSGEVLEVLGDAETFAVRVKRVKKYAPEIDRTALERRLGELIHKKTGIRVNLENPDTTFMGILTDRKFVFGIKLAEIAPKPFVERSPMKKPFFHPSAMVAKLARCMVNLATPEAGELVLDPFCGTGGMLIEAALIGCRVLGLDIQKRMVRGALQNLSHFDVEPEGLLVADAYRLPIAKVDCVVTDPPYGRSATTFRRPTKEIVERVLVAVYDLLEKERRLCMAAPKALNVGRIAEVLGYKHLESHFVYVHRSLTREISVFEKV